MTSKNDLSAFRRPPVRSVLAQPKAPESSSRHSEPRKKPSEKLIKRAQVMFTESEFEALSEKRGRVPLSVYLRDRLKELGEI